MIASVKRVLDSQTARFDSVWIIMKQAICVKPVMVDPPIDHTAQFGAFPLGVVNVCSSIESSVNMQTQTTLNAMGIYNPP